MYARWQEQQVTQHVHYNYSIFMNNCVLLRPLALNWDTALLCHIKEAGLLA